jgi:glycosyl transferase family 25
MQAFLINLARSPERRAHMLSELAKTTLTFEVVEGLDARDLDLSDERLVTPAMLARASFRRGAVGCTHSHHRVYRRILELGLDCGLVLEDDIDLPADLGELAETVASHMSGAEIVLLNWHAYGPVEFSKNDTVKLPNSRLLAYPVSLYRLTSGAAFLITAEACRRLEDGEMPMRTHCDDWEFFVGQGELDRVRGVVPRPIANTPVFRTTIDPFPAGSWQLRFREKVAKARVPLLQRVLAGRRARLDREQAKALLVNKAYVTGRPERQS